MTRLGLVAVSRRPFDPWHGPRYAIERAIRPVRVSWSDEPDETPYPPDFKLPEPGTHGREVVWLMRQVFNSPVSRITHNIPGDEFRTKLQSLVALPAVRKGRLPVLIEEATTMDAVLAAADATIVWCSRLPRASLARLVAPIRDGRNVVVCCREHYSSYAANGAMHRYCRDCTKFLHSLVDEERFRTHMEDTAPKGSVENLRAVVRERELGLTSARRRVKSAEDNVQYAEERLAQARAALAAAEAGAATAGADDANEED